MRLRNIPGAREAIAASGFVVQDMYDWKGKWNTLFHNNQPVHIEVGMGKGRFIMDLARSNPDVNYIGIEKYSSVLVRALEKLENQVQDDDSWQPENLYFIRMDAEELPQVFQKGEVGRIYLNFSDPWPKEKHARRRLTSREFFSRYDQILTADGRVEFKTDNRGLFDFSLEEIPAAGWHLISQTYDLLGDSLLSKGNVMTEYEEKFSSMGNPIHKLVAAR